MAADAAMSEVQEAWSPTRLPPGGSTLSMSALRDVFASAGREDLEASLRESLREALAAERVELHGSGRAALVSMLRRLAKLQGRNEVIVPAYTCYSVPAAAVAAGLRIRLVDVDAAGRIDRASLEQLPLDRACALVVSNLFGFAEAIEDIAALAARAGCAVIDDAAQALGASGPDGRAGARGHLALLSFGRGKPIAALGGGAIAVPMPAAGETGPTIPSGDRRAGEAAAGRALLRACLYNLACNGLVFRAAAGVPALHIGDTPFEANIEETALGGDALCLLRGALERSKAEAAERRTRALALADAVHGAGAEHWQALRGGVGDSGVFGRLALLASSSERRDDALRRLTRIGAGASAMYPQSLDCLEALAPHLVGDAPMPGGRRLAERLLTLPTHGRLRKARLRRALAVLADPT